LSGVGDQRVTQRINHRLLNHLAGRFKDAPMMFAVSRATLWRMTKAGLLQKIEVLPGSFRLRRADLEAIAAGQRNAGSS
jgi:hypothetical protein